MAHSGLTLTHRGSKSTSSGSNSTPRPKVTYFGKFAVCHIRTIPLLWGPAWAIKPNAKREVPQRSVPWRTLLSFSSRFYSFYRLEILWPYDLYLYCGGWVVVVVVVGRILAYASFEPGLLPNFLWELKTTNFLYPIASYQLKIWVQIKFFRISVNIVRIIQTRKQ